jgi:hypothetical protein
MNDDFLTQFRKEPSPELTARLGARLRSIDDGAESAPGAMGWLKPALATAASIAALVVALSVPQVRAAAQDFLDLFRVKRFIAVSVDPERIEQLRAGRVSVESLLSDNVEVLTPHVEPVQVASLDDASKMVGVPLLVPTLVDGTSEAPRISVDGERAARLTADVERLQGLLEVLGVSDVELPPQLDGAQVTVRIPAAVRMRYQRGDAWVATFTQARSPEIDLPSGVDLAMLGEIGLRISGMSADEAHDFARKVDWHGTLLVPVPAAAGSFRDVNVRGTTGLMITIDPSRAAKPNGAGSNESPRTILLWSEGDMIYALASRMHEFDVLEMANAIQHG